MIRLCAFSDEAAKDLKGQISALHRNNIHYTELRGIDGKNVSDFTEREAKEYAAILRSENIAVWSIGSPVGKVDVNVDFEEYIDKVKRIFHSANIFEAEKVRVFSFFNAYDQKDRVIGYMNRITGCARQFGLTVCHENEKDIYGDTVQRVKELLDNVDGLESVFDPANFIQTGEKADYALDVLHSCTKYFHIKDVIEKTGELVPAGFGDGDINKLIALINSDKVLTVEPHLALFDGYADIDNTQMKNKFLYKNNSQAFDAAVGALKTLLEKNNYEEIKGDFIKS